jgi:hypothetical protein
MSSSLCWERARNAVLMRAIAPLQTHELSRIALLSCTAAARAFPTWTLKHARIALILTISTISQFSPTFPTTPSYTRRAPGYQLFVMSGKFGETNDYGWRMKSVPVESLFTLEQSREGQMLFNLLWRLTVYHSTKFCGELVADPLSCHQAWTYENLHVRNTRTPYPLERWSLELLVGRAQVL